MSDFPLKDESYAIIGACMKVHTELGSGFKEAVYQEALEKEFTLRNIDFVRHKRLKLHYNGIQLSKYYVADFLCYGQIVLEVKATNYDIGLLINFGQPSLQVRRFIH